jgi:O-antigen/teichoic acid export membrane protein
MTLARMFGLILSLVGTRFAGAALGLLSQLLFARLFSRDDVGIIFLTMSAAAFASLAITGGYPALALTCLPRYISLGRNSLATAFLAAARQDTAMLGLVFLIIAGTVAAFAPLDNGVRIALVFACLTAPSSALIRLNSSIANSRRRYALSYVPDFIYRPGLLLLFVVLAWLIGIPLTMLHVLWAFLAVNIIVAVGQAYLLRGGGLFSGLWHTRHHHLAPYLRGRAASLVIVAAVATAFSDLVTLIGGFLLSHEDVAVLGVSVRLAAIAAFVTQAAQQFVLPDLTAALTKSVGAEARSLLRRVNIIALGTIGAFILAAVLLGGTVLSIFGPGYELGKWPFVLFLVGQAFRAAGGMNQHLLSLEGHQLKTAGACLIAIIVLTGLSILLAPKLGLIGIGIAVIVCEAVWALLLGAQAHRLAGHRGDILAVLRQRL